MANIQIPQGTILDITDYKKLGEDLKQHIINEVKATQMFVIQPLPDRLKMTLAQYQDLQTDMLDMQNTEDKLYRTPYNIMEVQVVG